MGSPYLLDILALYDGRTLVYNSSMKRIEIKTTIAAETKKALQKIAVRQNLRDGRGIPSKGRAIDYLAGKELKAYEQTMSGLRSEA